MPGTKERLFPILLQGAGLHSALTQPEHPSESKDINTHRTPTVGINLVWVEVHSVSEYGRS